MVVVKNKTAGVCKHAQRMSGKLLMEGIESIIRAMHMWDPEYTVIV